MKLKVKIIMKLKILGTGSSGNCYLFKTEKEVLIIDAGISFQEVKKELNFNLQNVLGVLQTHSHS